MADAVRRPFPLHSVPQDEITRIGVEHTVTDASRRAPAGATEGS